MKMLPSAVLLLLLWWFDRCCFGCHDVCDFGFVTTRCISCLLVSFYLKYKVEWNKMNYQTIIRWYIVSKHSEYTEFLERKLQLLGTIQFECCLTLLSWTPQIIGFYLYIFFLCFLMIAGTCTNLVWKFYIASKDGNGQLWLTDWMLLRIQHSLHSHNIYFDYYTLRLLKIVGTGYSKCGKG